eukprot:TRINITY_DN5445_c0_g1_i1.p1 TRINITY_DN5445_c0_g1~~TRINITY_DN5445_c0_g1_i1.p1  ORF type:complete len:207 (+),score=43.01 TRINITY_DN5445_c0_g1_i1:55-675(+)
MSRSLIRELGDPALRATTRVLEKSEFGGAELKSLVADMVGAMKDAHGAGIAAPQIGKTERVFIAYGSGNNPRYPYKPAFPLTVFVNPELQILTDEKFELWEGCLSVPGFRGQVERFARVKISAFTIEGNPFSIVAEGHLAGTLQHEYDHLEGRLFTDHARTGALCPIESIITAKAFEENYRERFFEHAFRIRDIYFKEPVFTGLAA